MKNTLSEIKQLGKTKPKKPKQLDLEKFLDMVVVFSYSVILEESNFKQFCNMVEVSEEVREKLQAFARTKSFANYISNLIFTITLNPEYNLSMPTTGKAKEYTEKFGLVILKNLVEELKTQSVENLASEADEMMQDFEDIAEIAEEKVANDFSKITEEMGV
ncbi:hypothetical protein NIES267_72540 (plasmid) [Calothrix parasitica NIES-267]|uniref:Uncharacterized protein n=1 Tax=Calothrix parasitica NIES-267 TaxID=1973488 RepID=A0A1Z4M2N3_9CYAN|nr:hypothetical protein NIES267_72540 [Calothrix parasitica NIES-267]